ncbi:hypothetical protein [Oscillibacter sp. GMB15532]
MEFLRRRDESEEKGKFLFSGGVHIGENTSQAANVEPSVFGRQ